MKIVYKDNSFVEIKLSNKPGHVDLVIGAKSATDPTKLQILSDSITLEDFARAIKDLGVQLPIIT